MDEKTRFNLWYLLIAIFAVLAIQLLLQQATTVERIPYSEFERLLGTGDVTDLVVGSEEIRGRYTEPHDGITGFATRRVDPAIAERLSEAGITYDAAIERTWLTDLLGWVVPVLFFLGLWFLIFRSIARRQGLGGMMQVVRSTAQL